ncbi:MAG TPA: DUF2795 domain-containing protein [Ignavibacteriales bacterium]|nr:DUF2795 domain-containing protein [Ignavibacteriales bacterium]
MLKGRVGKRKNKKGGIMARGVGGHGPANIMKHLKGLDFPANKSKLLSFAKRGEGPDTDDVLSILQQIPDKSYNSPAEVMKEVGHVE